MDTVSNRDVSQHLHGSALVQSSSGDVILTLCIVSLVTHLEALVFWHLMTVFHLYCAL